MVRDMIMSMGTIAGVFLLFLILMEIGDIAAMLDTLMMRL